MKTYFIYGVLLTLSVITAFLLAQVKEQQRVVQEISLNNDELSKKLSAQIGAVEEECIDASHKVQDSLEERVAGVEHDLDDVHFLMGKKKK